MWVWDRAADAFTHVPSDGTRKSCGSFTHLADGDILMAAGHLENDRQTVHTLSTTTLDFDRRADLTTGRWYSSSVSLPDGT